MHVSDHEKYIDNVSPYTLTKSIPVFIKQIRIFRNWNSYYSPNAENNINQSKSN